MRVNILTSEFGILTRGKKNVKIEFLLLALAYNLNKLHHKIQQNRLGVSFYTKAIA